MKHAGAEVRIGLLDYGMGNLRSVHRALEAVGGQVELVTEPAQMADKGALVFPGQGAIVDTMQLLQQSGWDSFIRDWIAADRPFFGVCLGLQALFEHSEEGDTPTLGIFPGRVRRFTRVPGDASCKIPHMGWNTVHFTRPHALLDGLPRDPVPAFYFVHSYFVDTPAQDLVFGVTDYAGGQFTSAIQRGNLIASQFHPEKSQALGLRLYRNFVEKLSCSETRTAE